MMIKFLFIMNKMDELEGHRPRGRPVVFNDVADLTDPLERLLTRLKNGKSPRYQTHALRTYLQDGDQIRLSWAKTMIATYDAKWDVLICEDKLYHNFNQFSKFYNKHSHSGIDRLLIKRKSDQDTKPWMRIGVYMKKYGDFRNI